MRRSALTFVFGALLGVAAITCCSATAQSQERRGGERGFGAPAGAWRGDAAGRGWGGNRGGWGYHDYGYHGYGYGYPSYYGPGYYGGGYAYPGYYNGYYTATPGVYVGAGPRGVGVGVGGAGFGFGWW
jgi:hypothetical protein